MAQGLRRSAAAAAPVGRPCADRPRCAACSRRRTASLAAGRKLAPRRRPSATSTRSTSGTRSIAQRRGGPATPRAPTSSAGATTACSTSRPRRTASCAGCAFRTASCSAWQFAGVADLAERYGGGYAHVTTRANLQIREIAAAQRGRAAEGLHDLGITSQGHRRGQHPQRHRHAHRRHRSAGADRHPAAARASAPPHPQRSRALRPAAQVQHRLRRRRARSPRSRTPTTSASRPCRVREGRGGAAPASTSAWRSAASPATRTSPATPACWSAPTSATPVAAAIVRVFIDHGDRTDRKKARLKYVLDRLGLRRSSSTDVEKKLGRRCRASPRRAVRAARRPIDRHGPRRRPPADAAGPELRRRASLPVGRLTVAQMRGLADIAARPTATATSG